MNVSVVLEQDLSQGAVSEGTSESSSTTTSGTKHSLLLPWTPGNASNHLYVVGKQFHASIFLPRGRVAKTTSRFRIVPDFPLAQGSLAPWPCGHRSDS